ncbi:MAG: hypothetical protein ACM3PE_11510 [Deltaproteobacteria bacterium]
MLEKIKSFMINNKGAVVVVIMTLLIGVLTLWVFHSALSKI